VQSFEIDPNTGLMYILDTGRRNFLGSSFTPNNTITPKVVVVDLSRAVDAPGFHVATFRFPEVIVFRARGAISKSVDTHMHSRAHSHNLALVLVACFRS
jgi:hypothetical protein